MEALNLASDDGLWFFWRGFDGGLWCVGGLRGYGLWVVGFCVLWSDGGGIDLAAAMVGCGSEAWIDCWVFSGGLFRLQNMLGVFVWMFCSDAWIDFCLLGSDGLDFGFRWIGFWWGLGWIWIGWFRLAWWAMVVAWWWLGCFCYGFLVGVGFWWAVDSDGVVGMVVAWWWWLGCLVFF